MTCTVWDKISQLLEQLLSSLNLCWMAIHAPPNVQPWHRWSSIECPSPRVASVQGGGAPLPLTVLMLCKKWPARCQMFSNRALISSIAMSHHGLMMFPSPRHP